MNSILSNLLEKVRLDKNEDIPPKLDAFISDFLNANKNLDVLLAPFALAKLCFKIRGREISHKT